MNESCDLLWLVPNAAGTVAEVRRIPAGWWRETPGGEAVRVSPPARPLVGYVIPTTEVREAEPGLTDIGTVAFEVEVGV